MKPRVDIEWYPDDFVARAGNALARGLTAGAIVLQTKMKEAVSKPSPPRSRPGNPPNKETGNLRRSITFQPAKWEGGRLVTAAAGVSLNATKAQESLSASRVRAATRRIYKARFTGKQPKKEDIDIATGKAAATSESYALWLEFGTTKMRPRPFLKSSLYRNKGEIINTVFDFMRSGLSGPGKK